ncbi:hypothetical protein GCM10027051_06470 [Niabella terrae]
MKKLIFAAFIVLGFASAAQAQISIQINIGNQPAWGPVGYDYARYYYLPAYNAYYDINSGRFIYLRRGNWIYASMLPGTYGRVDLYRTYKVVVNRNYAPYRDNRSDRLRYGQYRNTYNQALIRDSRDSRYFESRFHPMHQQWKNSAASRNNIARNSNNAVKFNRHADRRPSDNHSRVTENRNTPVKPTVRTNRNTDTKSRSVQGASSRHRTSGRR